MPSNYKILGQAVITNTPNSNQTVYTVPAGKSAVISSIIFTNDMTGWGSLHIVKSGQSIANTNRILTNVSVTTPVIIKGMALSAGDSVRLAVGNANGNFACQVFGAEID